MKPFELNKEPFTADDFDSEALRMESRTAWWREPTVECMLRQAAKTERVKADLVTALEGIERVTTCSANCEHDEDDRCPIYLARAALAKARGEAP